MAFENLPERSELLILDSDESFLKRLSIRLASAENFLVTSTKDTGHAIELTHTKHFPLILVDVDTPEAEAGLEVLVQLKNLSPASNVIVLLRQPNFEQGVRAF